MGVYYIWFNGDMLFKLIPMALIIIYGITQLPQKSEIKSYHLLTIIGLLFCISGDYLIQRFIIGLCAFLCGHIFYILSFKKQKSVKPPPELFIYIISIYALVMMTIMSLVIFYKGDLYLIVPVILYTAIIAFMAYTAWQTRNKWLIIGSLLFLISDSILAWNKFVNAVPFSTVLIMVTYYSANYFIATSLSRRTSHT